MVASVSGNVHSWYTNVSTELDEYVDESLGKDAIYISFGGKRERVCIPLVDDDEIKRVVDYLKNN